MDGIDKNVHFGYLQEATSKVIYLDRGLFYSWEKDLKADLEDSGSLKAQLQPESTTCFEVCQIYLDTEAILHLPLRHNSLPVSHYLSGRCPVSKK